MALKSDDRGKGNMTEVAEVSVGLGFPWRVHGCPGQELQQLTSLPHPEASCTLLAAFLWLRLPPGLLLGVKLICGCSRKHCFEALKVMLEHWLLPLPGSRSRCPDPGCLIGCLEEREQGMETESGSWLDQSVAVVKCH